MNKVETFLWGFVVGILTYAGCHAVIQHRLEAAAYQCALLSNGTDSAIEACYSDRNIPFPGY